MKEVVFHSKEEEAHRGEDKLAADLAEKVKVLCWVMTGPSNHRAKVRKAVMPDSDCDLSLNLQPLQNWSSSQTISSPKIPR